MKHHIIMKLCNFDTKFCLNNAKFLEKMQIFGNIWYQLYFKPSFAAAVVAAKAVAATASCRLLHLTIWPDAS
jgi:hypothetical protein